MQEETYFGFYEYLIHSPKNTSEVVKYLGEISKCPIVWFKDNQIQLNPFKCHLILSESITK